MVDLNLQKPKTEDDEPTGKIILMVMPFVVVFWVMLVSAL